MSFASTDLRTATCVCSAVFFSRDRDLFGEGAGFQREIKLYRASRVELHVRAADLLEAAQFDQKFIAAGVQVGKCVVAAAVGDGRVDCCVCVLVTVTVAARNDDTLRIFYCARNRASIELCESRRRYAQQPGNRSRRRGEGERSSYAVGSLSPSSKKCQTKSRLSPQSVSPTPRTSKGGSRA